MLETQDRLQHGPQTSFIFCFHRGRHLWSVGSPLVFLIIPHFLSVSTFQLENSSQILTVGRARKQMPCSHAVDVPDSWVQGVCSPSGKWGRALSCQTAPVCDHSHSMGCLWFGVASFSAPAPFPRWGEGHRGGSMTLMEEKLTLPRISLVHLDQSL